jgi:hypothetical protein
MGELKSARTLNDINAYAEFHGDFAPSRINRLAGISESANTSHLGARPSRTAKSPPGEGWLSVVALNKLLLAVIYEHLIAGF